MTPTAKLALALWLIVIAFNLALSADIRLEHFEDGAGIITYCLPLALCSEGG